MAKNTKKRAKFKEVTFRVSKAYFKNALENILMHVAPYTDNQPTLNGVKIHVESDYMELVATDGNTMLKSTVGLDEPIKGVGDIVLNGLYLSKMKLIKNYTTKTRSFSVFDILEITIKENEAHIKDQTNGITYKIPKIIGIYPSNTDSILAFKYDENKHLKVALNPNLIAKLKNLPRNNAPLIMFFEKENPLGMVHIETEDGGAKNAGGYDAVVMPCKVRE